MKLISKILVFFSLLALEASACDCHCLDDCSFHEVVKTSKLVALVKIVSYDSYLSNKVLGYDGQMPYSMTVEIIQKYKGSETRQFIKIWGDDGHLCRPYISNFEIGRYFLIAPSAIEAPETSKESKTEFELSSCATVYLKVDMKTKVAHGEYARNQDQVSLDTFSRSLTK